MVLAKSPSSLTVARPFLSFAVPKSSNQCSGLSMQWSTRCVPSGNATMPFFAMAVSVPLTTTLPKKRPAKEFGLLVWPTTPMLLGEKPNTPGPNTFDRESDVPITPMCVSEVPMTPAGAGIGPCVPEMPVTPVSAPEMLCTPLPKNDTARRAVPVKDAPCIPSPSREKPVTPGCVAAAPKTPERQPPGTGGMSSTWPVDADPGERDAGHPGELGGTALDASTLRIAVLLDRSLRIATAGESQNARHDAIPDRTEADIRNVVVIRVGQKAVQTRSGNA